LLLATDTKGNTAWRREAEGGKLHVLQKMWDFVKDYLTTDEVKIKMFLVTGSNGNTAGQMATFWGSLELFQKTLCRAKENLTTEEIKLSCF
jgi:hypothetical protein